MENDTWVVSIGRNVHRDQQLNSNDWDNFMAEVYATVEDYATRNGGEVVFFGEGYGVYQGHEEQSYTVIFTLPRLTFDVSIYPNLVKLADSYGQDAIALTCGQTQFVQSRKAAGLVEAAKNAIELNNAVARGDS